MLDILVIGVSQNSISDPQHITTISGSVEEPLVAPLFVSINYINMEVITMSKTRSITDLVQELQQENESLKGLEKLANQYCKQEFGHTAKELHDIVRKQKAYERKMKEQAALQQGQQIRISHSENQTVDRGKTPYQLRP